MSLHIAYTVFTKPWPDKSLPELARFVKDLGFDGVELPVRPNFQVIPETVGQFIGIQEGVEVFEGDVFSVEKSDEIYTAVVTYCESSFSFELVIHYKDGSKDFVDWDDYEAWKVGNIHDNKELLNEQA